MTLVTLVRAEFARLTSSKLAIASLVALMTVPLVYGGLYLWGNEDPYSNLDQVPAAIVVEDTGATVDGTAVDYGRDAADSLLEGARFGWHEVSAAQAARGVADGTYDFGLTFPPSFSADLASASSPEPTAARLDLMTDDTNSYLSTTLAKQAAEAVRVEVARQVGTTASATLLDSVAQLRDGLSSAQEGASTLANGAATADAGAATLSTGTATLADGAATLRSGLSTLDAKAAALPASASALSSGASKVADGAATAATTAASLAQTTAGASALQAKLAADAANAGITDPTVLADIAALGQATGGANRYAQGLSPALGTLSSGAAQVNTGAATLAAAAAPLATAVHSASTGAARLSAGAADAASGASALATGVQQLDSGAAQLDTSLADAIAQVPATTPDERNAAATLIANPVSVDQTALAEAANYGAGLAPFFLSLAAWIGMYALFLLVRPLSRRALTAGRMPIRTMLAGWATPAALGVIQMVALFAIATLGLRLEVANPLGLLGFLALTSVTFAAIILALNVLLGSVGQFLGLVLMVVQLVTAGGTFPWQTLPAPLAALHQALPMSHAVDGVRQLMYGGSLEQVWPSVLVLLLWMVGGLAAATFGSMRQSRTRSLRQLRPSPIGA